MGDLELYEFDPIWLVDFLHFADVHSVRCCGLPSWDLHARATWQNRNRPIPVLNDGVLQLLAAYDIFYCFMMLDVRLFVSSSFLPAEVLPVHLLKSVS